MHPPRPYRAAVDLAAMRAVLQTGRQAANGSYYVHIGDLNWWLFYPPLTHDFWQAVHLWDDPAAAGIILGWALVAPDGATFDVYLQPGLRGTLQAQEMYAWAAESAAVNARRAGRSRTGAMWIAADDAVLDAWLRDWGYRRVSEDMQMRCDLTAPLPVAAIPPGFIIRASRGEEEAAARARAQYGAFDSHADFGQYLARWRRFIHSPVYDPALDLVAAAEDGQIAAFAVVWLDDLNHCGHFEPVGTHPDFQRRGLGRAVMLAALWELQAGGMTTASVCTAAENTPAIRLYESIGFRVVNHLGTYKKELEG